jgi:hypothetical protein
MTALTRSIVRTVTPIAVGFLVSVLAHLGVPSPVAVSAVGAVASVIYYTGVRVLEARYPRLGVLLGALGAPNYSKLITAKTTVKSSGSPASVLGYSPTPASPPATPSTAASAAPPATPPTPPAA